MKAKLAVYGKQAIPVGYCQGCRRTAFIINNRLQCCDTTVNVEVEGYIIRAESRERRKRPSIAASKAILELQKNRCCYCLQSFGDVVKVKNKYYILVVHWDHKDPYSSSRNNSIVNFRAVCQFCNLWKGSRVFDSTSELIQYVQNKWKEARRTHLPILQQSVSTKNKVAVVLQSEMQNERLARETPKGFNRSEIIIFRFLNDLIEAKEIIIS